jgi:hypothetical protein
MTRRQVGPERLRLALCWDAVDRPTHLDVPQRMRRMLSMRPFITIGGFLAAALTALSWPIPAVKKTEQ